MKYEEVIILVPPERVRAWVLALAESLRRDLPVPVTFRRCDDTAEEPSIAKSPGADAPARRSVRAQPTIDRLCGWVWCYLRRLNAAFDGCVVAGSWLAERFASHGLRNLHVVPFGVDTASFGRGHRDNALRSSMLESCGLMNIAVRAAGMVNA